MRDNGSPPPAFESDDDRTWFLVRLPIHEAVRNTLIAQGAERDGEQGTDQVTEHETEHETEQVTQQAFSRSDRT
jgi:ATP-dependent DNA helicase RecG